MIQNETGGTSKFSSLNEENCKLSEQTLKQIREAFIRHPHQG